MRLRIFYNVFVFSILNYADNFDDRAVRTFRSKAFSKRILIGPELLGHGLIDHRDAGRFLIVGIGERAAAMHRDRKRFEIGIRNHVVVHDGRLLPGFNGMTIDGNAVGSAHHAQRNGESLRDVDDAGERAEAQIEFAIKNAALIFLIIDLPNIDREIENAARIESKINCLRLAEASNKKSGDDEKHERTCDLRDHERAANKLAAASAGEGGVIYNFNTSSEQSLAQLVQVAGDEGGMSFSGRAEIGLDADVELLRAAFEPAAASGTERVRLGNLGQAKEGAVKFASRDTRLSVSDLRVVCPSEAATTCLQASIAGPTTSPVALASIYS